MKTRKIKQFSIGPVGSAIIGIFFVPLMGWTFNPDDIGRFNIFQITLTFILLLTVLGLDQSYVREYHESNDKPQLFLNCFVPGFFLLIVLTLISFPHLSHISRVLFEDSNSWLVLMVILGFFNGYISRFVSLILRMKELGIAYSMSQILPKILQLILIIAIGSSALEKKFIYLIVISLIAQSTVSILLIWIAKDELQRVCKSRIDLDKIYEMLIFGLPLVLSGIIYWALTAISTIVIRSLSDFENIAIYSMAANLAGAAIVLQSIFSLLWGPIIFKIISDGGNLNVVERVMYQILAVICLIISLTGIFSWLSDYILPSDYLQVKYVVLCMLFQPLLYTLSEVTSIGINIRRRSIHTIWTTFAALSVNLSLGLTLVPSYGAAGAAMANAIAFTVYFVLRTEISSHIWRRFPMRKVYSIVSIFLALTISTILFGDYYPIGVHVMWLIIFLLTILRFKIEIREIMIFLKK